MKVPEKSSLPPAEPPIVRQGKRLLWYEACIRKPSEAERQSQKNSAKVSPALIGKPGRTLANSAPIRLTRSLTVFPCPIRRSTEKVSLRSIRASDNQR